MSATLRERLQSSLAGAYTIERELGGGAMSRAFVADEAGLERKVVVKVLPPELSVAVSAERFAREIRLTASLQQANIIPVLATGECSGVPYYVMPFVEGESLRAQLARIAGPLPPADVVRILEDVTRGLAYAHEHGVIHRDIKPENILLSGGTAVITDFGIAKALAAARGEGQVSITDSEIPVGTAAYMAPEQAAGDDVDHRSDIYSVGALAYELLTGFSPFAGRSRARTLAAHVSEIPRDLRDLRHDVPRGLAELVMRCLEKDPARRPQTAGELANGISAAMSVSWRGDENGRAPAARAAHPTRVHTTYARAVMILTGAMLLAAFLQFREVLLPAMDDLTGKRSLTGTDQLIVTDFRAPSDDPLLGMVASEAVRTSLAQSASFRLVSANFISNALARMRRAGSAPLDLAAALEIAQREGLKAIIDGSITPAGDGYLVTIRLVSAAEGNSLLTFVEAAADVTDFIPAIDRLTFKLRRRMGESLVSVQGAQPMVRVTTASLPALRKYSQGMALHYRDLKFADAAAAFEEAIQIDSTFIMAYERAWSAYENAGTRPGRRDSLLFLAFQSRHKLGELERRLVEGAYFARMGHRDSSILAYERALILDSDQPWVWSRLGNHYTSQRDNSKAVFAYRRATALDPDFPMAHVHILFPLVAMNRLDDARAAANLARSRFPSTTAQVRFIEAGIELLEGRLDTAAARLAQSSAAGEGGWGERARHHLADHSRLRGKLGESARLRANAVARSAARTGDPQTEYLLLDSIENDVWIRGRRALGVQRLDAAIAKPSWPLADLLHGARLYGLAGQAGKARNLVARFDLENKDSVQGRFHQARQEALGAIALAEGRHADAIAEFRAAYVGTDGMPRECPICADQHIMLAFDAAGMADSAIAVRERFVRTPYFLRWYRDGLSLAESHRRLGDAYTARGNVSKAIAHYTRFVELWQDADADLQPRVAQARRRLAELKGLASP